MNVYQRCGQWGVNWVESKYLYCIGSTMIFLTQLRHSIKIEYQVNAIALQIKCSWCLSPTIH